MPLGCPQAVLKWRSYWFRVWSDFTICAHLCCRHRIEIRTGKPRGC